MWFNKRNANHSGTWVPARVIVVDKQPMMNLATIYDIESYVAMINDDYQSKETTEHSFRGTLQNLLKKMLNMGVKKEYQVAVINEPKRKDYGAPDFEFRKNDVAIAFLETKDLDDNDVRGTKKHKEQFDRYKKAVNNIAFTNYLNFVLYENGEEFLSAQIGEIVNGEVVVTKDQEQLSNFEEIVRRLGDAKPQPIRSASLLAEAMSAKAKIIADVLNKAMEKNETDEDKELHEKLESFKKYLVHDMKPEQFTDFYAQTIVYGLFIARIYDKTPQDFSLQEAAELIPAINPFLKKIFKLLALAQLHSGAKWIVEDLVSIFRVTDINKVLRNYGKDPLVHFYEDFLEAYNPKIREEFGVWYTPKEVVKFIVDSVDTILKTKLDIKEGLSNNTPVDDNPDMHKVQILDPATGTGTFLAVAAEKIYESYKGQEGLWPEDVVKHIIPRLNGFEYLMAPYTMAHLKVATSLRLDEIHEQLPERLQIFLTNSLEEEHPEQKLDFAKFITDESNAASKIKRDTPVMVVMGNPPYNEKSANKGEWIMDLMDDYKQEPGMVREQLRYDRRKNEWVYKNTLKEPNPKAINNDYCKFIRLGQKFVERTQEGVLAYICGNTFLDTRLFRGMRYELMKKFDEIYIINLHGSTKRQESREEQKDECVFKILVGVSINIFIKRTDSNSNELAKVFYKDVYGTRSEKLQYLENVKFENVDFVELTPTAPLYTFRVRDHHLRERYDTGFEVEKLMKKNVQGFTTDKDKVAIKSLKSDMENIVSAMLSDKSDLELRDIYGFKDNRDWKLADGRALLKKETNWRKFLIQVQYRPFDIQWTLFHKALVTYPRPLIQESILNRNNYVLCLGKAGNTQGESEWTLAYISTIPTDKNVIPRGGVYLFPLFVYDKLGIAHTNFSKQIVRQIEKTIGKKLQQPYDKGRAEDGFLPIDLIDYIYAFLHSTLYRETYHECLQDGFPTIPYPSSADYFFQMSNLGKQIRELHLLANIDRNDLITSYPVRLPSDNNVVTERKFVVTNEGYGQVWINKKQYFDNVPIGAWNLMVSGYQPLDKWLKDRQGKQLTNEEVIHYQKIVVALQKQIEIMDEINRVIEI